MMNEFVREIFNAAVIREQSAQRLYFDLAKKASSGSVKEVFERLASEEKLHENLFSKMDLDVLKKVNSDDLNSIKVRFVGDAGSVQDKRDIVSALNLAISEEQKAYDDYMILVNHLPEGEGRNALKEIALQESRHKVILQKVMQEFDKGDWNEG